MKLIIVALDECCIRIIQYIDHAMQYAHRGDCSIRAY